MDCLSDARNIQSLCSLLCPDDQDENIPGPTVPGGTALTPGTITGPKGTRRIAPPNVKVTAKTPCADKAEKRAKQDDIWGESEVEQGITLQQDDHRTEPEYEILYRQKVGTEDVYLGMSDRDVSSDHCEEITIKIELPDTKLPDITLETLRERLIVMSPKYRLNLALPYAVKKDQGSAKWDGKKQVLKVVLPIERDVRLVDLAGAART
ncbi:unnamed protein product [Vitrella brassicaformis CCMP3155]|uniref:PIH1D1/2/3 CS-like domain-containing protein n=1 Tax=Vitrella brassicaformis (strain CCMP3155) TaxID=1169540 RepID=A0A0G4FUU8_VITBC|nr:unnamed protein product [Vitrella brassicaformis CCMP3155]|eukprot:CEM18730.1 unnamed protein product [Vitrella brassicaformis CCMP3155]